MIDDEVHKDNIPGLAQPLFSLYKAKRKKNVAIPVLHEELIRVLSFAPEYAMSLKETEFDKEFIDSVSSYPLVLFSTEFM
jgi:hypothetical protein